MAQNIVVLQNKVLKILAGKIDDFYLVGGSALSLYYFNHRQSEDLDFFTKDFNRKRIEEIIKLLENFLKKKSRLVSGQMRKDRVRILVYYIPFRKNRGLKIDFVEDYVILIKPPKSINGINVLSLEDIYIRKIYAITGTKSLEDSIGRKITIGGRQEAKDFYDLYFLSHTFIRLSEFSLRFGNPFIRENLIRWFRTYNRMDIKSGLLEFNMKKGIDYKDMEQHFKREIDRIIEKEADFV
jgi:hypothetical protein